MPARRRGETAAAAMTLPIRVERMETNMTWTWRCEDAGGSPWSRPEEDVRAASKPPNPGSARNWRTWSRRARLERHALWSDERVEYG